MTLQAGWYPDPSGRQRSRYWDGQHWTSWVDEFHRQDPLAADETFAPPDSESLGRASSSASPAHSPERTEGCGRSAAGSAADIVAWENRDRTRGKRRGVPRVDRSGLVGAVLLLTAFVLLVVGTFLPWVTTRFDPEGTFSGWVLARDDIGVTYADEPDFFARPFVVVMLGCAAVFAAIGMAVLVKRGSSDIPESVRRLVLWLGWLGVVAGAVCGLVIAVIFSGEFTDLQWGFWVVVLGGVTAFTGMTLITLALNEIDFWD